MSAVRIPIWTNYCQKPHWGKTPWLIWIHLYNLLKASKEQDCIKQSHDKDPQEFTRLYTINVNSPHLRLLFFFQPMLMTICWVLVVSGNVWSVDTSPAGQMSGIISRQSMLDPRVTIALCVQWYWKIGLLSGIIFPDLTNKPLDWFLICVHRFQKALSLWWSGMTEGSGNVWAVATCQAKSSMSSVTWRPSTWRPPNTSARTAPAHLGIELP